jgi:drug/metabolite transporter (DMT)-like permease
MAKSEFRGYLYILIGSTLWGISSVVAKSLFNIGIPLIELVLIRLILSTSTLLILLLLFNPQGIVISLKDLPYFLALGIVGVTGMQYAYLFSSRFIHPLFSTLIPFGLYFKGIEHMRATRASIAATWEPVVAGVTAYFVLGEVLFPLQVLGGIGVIAAIMPLQIAKEKAAPPTPIEIRQKE